MVHPILAEQAPGRFAECYCSYRCRFSGGYGYHQHLLGGALLQKPSSSLVILCHSVSYGLRVQPVSSRSRCHDNDSMEVSGFYKALSLPKHGSLRSLRLST